MKKYIKRLIVLGIIALLIGLYFFFDIGEYLTFEQLTKHRDSLLAYVNNYYVLSVLIYMGVYTAAMSLALPGGALLSIAGGFVFGTIIGAIYINISATIGATIAFLLTRYIIGNAMQERYSNRIEQFNSNLNRYGAYYLLMLRLVMIVPFFIINVVAGLTRISVWTFVWTTALGIIPGSLVFTYAGQSLTTINAISDILNWKVILAGVLLALVALVPMLIKALRKKPINP